MSTNNHSPAGQPSPVTMSVPGELARHAENLAKMYLESQGEPKSRSEVVVAMKSMFVAGWIDWALNARKYAPPEVK